MIRSRRFITFFVMLAVTAVIFSARPGEQAQAQQRAKGQGKQKGKGQGGPKHVFAGGAPSHPFDVVLGRPTDRAVTASVLAYQRMEGYITYGMEKEHHTVKTEVMTLAPENPVEFVLKDLKADTHYFYRIHTRALDRAGIPIG